MAKSWSVGFAESGVFYVLRPSIHPSRSLRMQIFRRSSPFAKRSPSSQAPQNMIAGLISPPVESPGQESDNDSLPGQGYTSSHASSDDDQPAILLLDDSTSSSHANQRRQASHPSDSQSTHSEPSAEAPGKYCAIASCCALRTTTVCLNPRPLKPVSLFNAGGAWQERQR